MLNDINSRHIVFIDGTLKTQNFVYFTNQLANSLIFTTLFNLSISCLVSAINLKSSKTLIDWDKYLFIVRLRSASQVDLNINKSNAQIVLLFFQHLYNYSMQEYLSPTLIYISLS